MLLYNAREWHNTLWQAKLHALAWGLPTALAVLAWRLHAANTAQASLGERFHHWAFKGAGAIAQAALFVFDERNLSVSTADSLPGFHELIVGSPYWASVAVLSAFILGADSAIDAAFPHHKISPAKCGYLGTKDSFEHLFSIERKGGHSPSLFLACTAKAGEVSDLLVNIYSAQATTAKPVATLRIPINGGVEDLERPLPGRYRMVVTNDRGGPLPKGVKISIA